jgi:hypothetical protein
LLLGTDAPGDGGVGLLWWNYEETTAADGIDYFGNANPAFNTTGRWIRLPFALTNMITGGGGGGSGITNLVTTYPLTLTSSNIIGMSITNGLVYLPEGTQSTPTSGIKISSIQPGGSGRDIASIKEASGYSYYPGKQQQMFVRNVTGTTIDAGKVVYFSGDDANTGLGSVPVPTIALAIATNLVKSTVAGITAESIATGGSGYIVTSGLMNFNTSSPLLATNLQYYAHPTTDGGMTATRPGAANQLITPIGRVISIGTNGRFWVQIGTPSLSAAYNLAFADRLQVFGSGADGTVSINTPTVATRDLYYTSLTMSAGGSLNMNGHRLFVNTTLNLVNADTKAIFAGGSAGGYATNNASSPGGIGGAATTAGTITGVPAATTGPNGIANGSGVSPSATAASTGTGGAGGAGGKGGGFSSFAGGAAVAGGTVGAQHPIHRAAVDMLYGATLQGVGGNGSGGSSGGSSSATILSGGAGGGGGAGGMLWVAARVIARGSNVNTDVLFAGGGRGGGGGGGGGQLRLHYEILTSTTGDPQANWLGAGGGRGGNGGTGINSSTGGDGGTGGSSGYIWAFDLLQGVVTYSAPGTAGSAGGVAATTAGGTGGSGAQVRVTL